MRRLAFRVAAALTLAAGTHAAACASSGGPPSAELAAPLLAEPSAPPPAASDARPDVRPTVPAGVTLDERVATYPVRGRTAAAVWRSMTAAAPAATGSTFHGRTEFALAWRWRAAAGAGGGCALRDPAVAVTSRTTIPALVPDAAADPGLAAGWAAYDAALRRHERGHEAIAVQAAGDLLRVLRRVHAFRCADADREGDATAREALARLQAAERAYDDSTGHGRTQGAVWPPNAGR